MGDYLPKFQDGAAVTFTAEETIIGGHLVEVAGARSVVTAVDGSDAVVGVAGFDVESGDRVTVFTRAGGMHPLVAAASVDAGARVGAASAGRVRPVASEEAAIGVTLTAAAAGATVELLFA